MKMKGCSNFTAKDYSLRALPMAIVGPWIYVNFAADVNISDSDVNRDLPDLQALVGLLNETNYADLVHIKQKRYELNCNWKVFVDNYLDGGYHVGVAHPSLSANLDLDQYERIDFQNFHLQTCPSSPNSNNAVDKDRISGGQPGKKALYIFQYPNIMINRYGQWMDTNIVWPVSPNKCVVDFDWYIHPSIAGDEKLIESSLAASEKVQEEDIWLCDRVQRGIQSRGYDVGRYAPSVEGKLNRSVFSSVINCYPFVFA
jgi:choline monooxygenase